MPEKDPTSYSIVTYAWVLFLSCWGGLVGFYRKYKLGYVRAFNIAEFFGDIFTSGFVGVITFYLCESSKMDPLLTAAFVGVSGHMGSRAIFQIEAWAMKRLKT
jgi:NhaP-type Na+/H+ and K+/H+ antiporter